MTRTDDRPAGARPPAIDVAAAILVFGGLFGFSQLAVGDFAVTGSLPTLVPIFGVAIFMNGASVALGILIRGGRGWLPALSLSALYALLYLAALGRPIHALLGAAHLASAAILLVHRRWFAQRARR